MSLNSSMDRVLERRREVEERLSASANMISNDLAQLSRELSDLRPICDQIELVRRIEAELADALLMVDEAGDDSDMLEMAQAEAALLKAQMPEAHRVLQIMLLPKDKDDARNAILEVRAGTGGTRQRFLPRICFRCISVLLQNMVGILKLWKCLKPVLAATRKLLPRYLAMMFSHG